MPNLSGYDLHEGDSVLVLIPTQYAPSKMFDKAGVQFDYIGHTAARWVLGTFRGRPAATSGHWFETAKPIDGGLMLVAADSAFKYPATAADMVAPATARAAR